MSLTTVVRLAALACLGVAGAASMARAEARVFELRTYTCVDGGLDALKKRFREHTIKLFDKHGMTSIGYWTPQDGPPRRTR